MLALKEFVINFGPDDLGLYRHEGKTLFLKYGKRQGSAQFDVQSFKNDLGGAGSGIYQVKFRYNDRTGILLSHYDSASRQFDRDEIVPDK